MSKFSDLPPNATPSNDDLLAIEQDADGLNRKVKFSEMPIVTDLASTATGKGASLVSVEDVAGNFTATTQEGVNAELYAMMDGMDQWVSATTYAIGDVVILTTNNVIYRCITANSDVTFTGANWKAVGKDRLSTIDDTISGSNQTVTAITSEVIRLTNAALVSIDMVPQGIGQSLYLLNNTGVSITINDQTGATVEQRIKTGLDASLTLADNQAIQIVYDETDSRWQVVGGTGGGGGGGGLDSYLSEDFEVTTSADFTVGNNATFLGAGALDGAISDETAAPLSKLVSIKYTAGATSLNDFIASQVIDLDLKQRANDSGITKYFTWSGSTDVEVVVWDVTNSKKLNSTLDVINNAGSATRYASSFYPPANCTQIRYGFHFLVAPTNGDILIFDDVELSTNPFVSKDLIETQYYKADGFAGNGSTNTTIPYFTNVTEDTGGFLTIDNSSTNGLSFTATKDCVVQGSYTWNDPSTGTYGWSINSSQLSTAIQSITQADKLASHSSPGSTYQSTTSTNISMKVGDVLRPHTSGGGANTASTWIINVTATATTEHIVTPAKSNMTDWKAYTPIFTGFGTNTNISTQYRRLGSSIELRGSFTFGTLTATEARISLPTNLTSSSIIGTLEVAGFGGIDRIVGLHSMLIESGVTYITMGRRDNAGVLTKANGDTLGLNGDVFSFTATLPIEEWSADVSFLAAVPVQKVAYVKDVKAALTNGGTFTSGAWQTRDLNTLEGDTSFVSLSANQFTLGAGEYQIEASTVSRGVDNNKIVLYNTTTSNFDIIGQSCNSSGGFPDVSVQLLSGSITISSSEVFEIQHRCQTSSPDNTGWGQSAGMAGGLAETYTTVKITKLR